MLQVSQDLPFLPEAAQHEIGVHAAIQELDSDLLLVMVIIPHAEVDCAHSPAADQADDPVRSDAPASHVGFGFPILRIEDSRKVNEVLIRSIARQQRLHFAPQILISLARLNKEQLPFRKRTLERLAKKRLSI